MWNAQSPGVKEVHLAVWSACACWVSFLRRGSKQRGTLLLRLSGDKIAVSVVWVAGKGHQPSLCEQCACRCVDVALGVADLVLSRSPFFSTYPTSISRHAKSQSLAIQSILVFGKVSRNSKPTLFSFLCPQDCRLLPLCTEGGRRGRVGQQWEVYLPRMKLNSWNGLSMTSVPVWI